MTAINSFEFSHEDRSESADEIRLISCSSNRSPAFFSGERDFDIEEPVKIWSVFFAVLTYEYSTDFAMLFSPAKIQSPPNLKRRRTIEEIEADPDLLPETKRKKKLGKLQWI